MDLVGTDPTAPVGEHRTAAGIRLGADILWQPAEPWGSATTSVAGSLSGSAAGPSGALTLALDVDGALPPGVRRRARSSWLHGKVLAYAEDGGVALVVPGMLMSVPLMGEALRRHHYGHEDRLAA